MPTIIFPGEGNAVSTTLTIRGAGLAGDSVIVADDYQRLGQSTVDPDGQWALDVELEPGNYGITAELRDEDDIQVAISGQVRFSVIDADQPGPQAEAAPVAPDEAAEFIQQAEAFLKLAHYRNDFGLGPFRGALERHLQALKAAAE